MKYLTRLRWRHRKFLVAQALAISDYQLNSLIPRVPHEMWGESAEALRGVFDMNTNFTYVHTPRSIIGVGLRAFRGNS